MAVTPEPLVGCGDVTFHRGERSLAHLGDHGERLSLDVVQHPRNANLLWKLG
jgi:hypothetical protein